MPAARRPPSGRSGTGARGTGTRDARARSASRAPTPREPRKRSDLLSRIFVAVPAAVLAIAFDGFGGLAWTLMMILLGAACLHELYRMLARWRPVPAVGFVALAGMALAARYGGQRQVLEVALAALPMVFIAVVMRARQGGATVAIAGTLLGVYWIGFAFAHAVLLRDLPHGNGVIIDVLVGTFLGDTAAYLGGRLFGRRPLAPEISPNKTVEGLFCGMLVAFLAVFLAGIYQTWMTKGDALALGLAVAVLGPLGDLFESLIKRDAGAKDAGSLFGAHGGALDRLDAVIFTIVAAYYVWVAVVK
ncbi:MAG: phosphatidate cytidylyltransferase [Solirubrobacteraceae bacterium]